MNITKEIKQDYYIGLIKRKRILVHKRDVCNEREKIAIAKMTINENININYDKTKKFANYNNRNYVYCCKVIEIISSCKACNSIEYFSIGNEWQWLLQGVKKNQGKVTETPALNSLLPKKMPSKVL